MRRCLLAIAACAAACGRYPSAATVTVAVSGPGGVRAAQLQGDCRATCWFSVQREAPVHLEPVGDPGAVFMGWSGACSGTGACELKPDFDASVAATFVPAEKPIALSVEVSSGGSILSTPAAIDCPRICSATFAPGVQVTLAASAAPGFTFAGFSGDCSGTLCSLQLSADVHVKAAFAAIPAYTVTVTLEGDGAGRVTSTPAGIDCPGACAAVFVHGTDLVLSAVPDPLSQLTGYGAACAGGSCSLSVTADAAVRVRLDLRRYSVRVLDAPADTPDCYAVAIASGAPIAGYWMSQGVPRSALWHDVFSDLGLPDSYALGVNASGAVTGTATFGPEQHAFLWSEGTVTDLGTLGGVESHGYAINASGTIAGWSTRADGVLRAVLWTSSGIVDLGSLASDGGSCSLAFGINSAGVAVGESCTAVAGSRAVAFRAPGVIDDLGSFGGWSSARAINDSGVVVGASQRPDGDTHAFVYADGKMIDAGTLMPPGTHGYSSLRAINNKGIAVGLSNLDGVLRGVIYGAGRMLDLNRVAVGAQYRIDDATGIDEEGNILAHGSAGGGGHALLLQPL